MKFLQSLELTGNFAPESFLKKQNLLIFSTTMTTVIAFFYSTYAVNTKGKR